MKTEYIDILYLIEDEQRVGSIKNSSYHDL